MLPDSNVTEEYCTVSAAAAAFAVVFVVLVVCGLVDEELSVATICMTIPVSAEKPARVLPFTATAAEVLSVMENSMGVFSESSLPADVMLSGEQAATRRVDASAMGRIFFFIILYVFKSLIFNI